jgi:UDP-N-acetyl-D-glucosamine dehydrogenase
MKYSGYTDTEFNLAFSPERIDPMNKTWNLENTPKLVAGVTSAAQIDAEKFYSKFVKNIIKCESIEIAETAKLLENSFRLINISFINELLIFCEKLNIDINEVIKSASTKPYGFMPFRPGVGVGGHCIPVDPLYLTWWARQSGVQAKFVESADSINHAMPKYVAERALSLVNPEIKTPKVLILGVAYKPGVADVRETPATELRNYLIRKGATVAWHDPLVSHWEDSTPVDLGWDCDVAILATKQPGMALNGLTDRGVKILDCTNTVGNLEGVSTL